MNSLFFALVLSLFAVSTLADIPVHCLYDDYYGEWTYYLGPAGGTNRIDCSKGFDIQYGVNFQLKYPDVALDKDGRSGFWTRIYDEGVELTIDGVKYFAFSYYDDSGYDCSQTLPGWYHDEDGTNWGCFYGVKVANGTHPGENSFKKTRSTPTDLPEWHPTLSESKKSQISIDDLPENFDWRDVNGVNYVSPIRDQASCGSCYIFATTAMMEARIRIMTDNKLQPVLSAQNTLSCSEYSQGCDGGFPYLVTKYGEDFSYVPEECFPYTAQDDECTPCELSEDDMYYDTGYYYVGGYYGACSAEEMMMELFINGPVVIGFKVYSDFYSYTDGVYVHNTTIAPETNPWEATSHAVCLVGYGVDDDGTPFWTVKNSWGTDFGEDGYFRILRGSDECAIESMALAATPILPQSYTN